MFGCVFKGIFRKLIDFQSSALPTELPSHKNITEHLKSVAKLVGQKGKTKRFDNIIKKGHTT